MLISQKNTNKANANYNANDNKIDMVAFDVAGTTVRDDGSVISAFETALAITEPQLWKSRSEEWIRYALDTMGRSKIQVFTELLVDKERARAANEEFERAYLAQLPAGGICPIEGAEETITKLREEGAVVVLTTGFNRETLDAILKYLCWENLVDFTVTPSEVERGRPHPDMLIAAQRKFGFTNASHSVVVGDTTSDMFAGVAFGSSNVIGVLTGAHDRISLYDAGATTVINSVANLMTHI